MSDEVRTIQVRTNKRFPGFREFKDSEMEPEVRGRRGKLYPWSEEEIAVFVTSSLQIFRKIAALPGARVFNQGDSEGTVIIPNALLVTVAEMIGASKIRRMTEEQKQAGAERLARHRFPSSSRTSDANQGQNTDDDDFSDSLFTDDEFDDDLAAREGDFSAVDS